MYHDNKPLKCHGIYLNLGNKNAQQCARMERFMDVLSRIDELREARGWSEYQLSVESGLTQSTISSWYRKNMLPTLPSLERICDAFDISLSQFFMEQTDETVTLSEQQKKLLQYTIRLEPEQLDALLNFLQTL